MRFILTAMVAVVAATTVMVQPAFATRESCKAAITAEGHETQGWRAAMTSAIRHWQREALEEHGRGFADWYYSADRTITCKWDNKGVRYQCIATAKPCGPR